MRITSCNFMKIKDLYLHDFIFSGFCYDYAHRTVRLGGENLYLRKRVKLEFQNVIGFHMQACGFWGSGNSMRGINPGDGDLLASYKKTVQADDMLQFADLLDPENEFIEFEIELNSGGMLTVVCEALNAEECD